MKNKGFTLIELLAVILILGVIALIAIPSVNSVVNQSKIKANVSTAQTYVKQAQGDCQIKQLNGENYEGVYSLNDFKDKVSGGKDVQGYLTYNNKCEVEIVMQADNTKDYCYVKSFDDDIARYYDNVNGICTPKEVEPVEDSCFDYVEDNGEITITGYKCGGKLTEVRENRDELEVFVVSHTTGEKMDVVIPSKINNKPVTKIGEGAFSPLIVEDGDLDNYEIDYNKKVIINSVVIPSSIKIIDFGAFFTNDLKSVVFSEGLEVINQAAFMCSGDLKNVVFPNSLKELEGYSFETSGVTSVVFGNNLKIIEDGTFYMNKINSISLNNIEEVKERAFMGNNITGKIVLGDKIKTVGLGAFAFNQISSLDFKNLESIEEGAFAHNNISGKLEIGNHIHSIGNGAFYENYITEVVVPSSVTEIGLGAFYEGFGESRYSNENLKKIINKTGRAFDWNNIIHEGSDTPFATGFVNNSKGEKINIVSE